MRRAGMFGLALGLSVSCASQLGPRAATESPPPLTDESTEPLEDPAHPRPPWLGQRVLPVTESGYGEIRPTPRILRDRRLETIDLLAAPASLRFSSDIGLVPKSVLRRSTWQPECPVVPEDLAYVTLSFWGFDEKPHTGELLVHRDAAEDVSRVFKTLYQQLFPIEEMRITTKAELDAPPTGDGNNTGAFVCRPARGSTSWSEHAFGLAIDVNPFHNPYVKGEIVLPELASAYEKRGWLRPGMVLPGGPVVRAFESIGWSWGGNWSSAKDWMHFSRSGR